MVTVGGTISGYWEIGRVTIEMPPQMIISKAMVAAKIGLLMKKSSKVIVHGYGVRNHPPVEVELFFLASEVGAVVAFAPVFESAFESEEEEDLLLECPCIEVD